MVKKESSTDQGCKELGSRQSLQLLHDDEAPKEVNFK